MTVLMKPESPSKAALSVASMCRHLKMSRSQFYWHVKRGTFHEPLYLASNKRPYFTASMVEDNLRARESGLTVSGEFVIFYERPPKTEERATKTNHGPLLDGLKALGLEVVTHEQLEIALAS